MLVIIPFYSGTYKGLWNLKFLDYLIFITLTGPEADLPPRTWKLSAQLNVLFSYLLRRVQQQQEIAASTWICSKKYARVLPILWYCIRCVHWNLIEDNTCTVEPVLDGHPSEQYRVVQRKDVVAQESLFVYQVCSEQALMVGDDWSSKTLGCQERGSTVHIVHPLNGQHIVVVRDKILNNQEKMMWKF